jgi:stage III sporulation protein SpoIIIAA
MFINIFSSLGPRVGKTIVMREIAHILTDEF